MLVYQSVVTTRKKNAIVPASNRHSRFPFKGVQRASKLLIHSLMALFTWGGADVSDLWMFQMARHGSCALWIVGHARKHT